MCLQAGASQTLADIHTNVWRVNRRTYFILESPDKANALSLGPQRSCWTPRTHRRVAGRSRFGASVLISGAFKRPHACAHRRACPERAVTLFLFHLVRYDAPKHKKRSVGRHYPMCKGNQPTAFFQTILQLTILRHELPRSLLNFHHFIQQQLFNVRHQHRQQSPFSSN